MPFYETTAYINHLWLSTNTFKVLIFSVFKVQIILLRMKYKYFVVHSFAHRILANEWLIPELLFCCTVLATVQPASPSGVQKSRVNSSCWSVVLERCVLMISRPKLSQSTANVRETTMQGFTGGSRFLWTITI